MKKKPEGERWDAFVDAWYVCNHAGKVELAKGFGTTYETARHWISDNNATRKPDKPETKMTVDLDELLGMRPACNLDFVCFDLETSNLQADFSIVLTACIKPYGQETRIFRSDDYEFWTKDRANDREIIVAVASELRRHAIVVGHYSSKFDIPFLRAKMTKYGLDPLPPMFGLDSWRIAKQNFQVSSRRLANLVSYFNIGEKEAVEGGLWMDAAYNGNREAMDAIVAHNITDVEVLEKLACISFPYVKAIPKL